MVLSIAALIICVVSLALSVFTSISSAFLLPLSIIALIAANVSGLHLTLAGSPKNRDDSE